MIGHDALLRTKFLYLSHGQADAPIGSGVRVGNPELAFGSGSRVAEGAGWKSLSMRNRTMNSFAIDSWANIGLKYDC
jgi:hypothetical protein